MAAYHLRATSRSSSIMCEGRNTVVADGSRNNACYSRCRYFPSYSSRSPSRTTAPQCGCPCPAIPRRTSHSGLPALRKKHGPTIGKPRNGETLGFRTISPTPSNSRLFLDISFPSSHISHPVPAHHSPIQGRVGTQDQVSLRIFWPRSTDAS